MTGRRRAERLSELAPYPPSVTDDATLTDFLADDDAEQPVADPATPTAAWGSYTCAACGVTVDRVWRAEEGFVCPDCKPW